MIQDIINICGPFNQLPWVPELIAGIVFIILITTALNFIFYMIQSIFKL